MECRHLDRCTLFPRMRDETDRAELVDRYCRGPQNLECERFKMGQRGFPIPIDMLPDGSTLEDQ